MTVAHRWAWVFFFGEIPKTNPRKVIDHLCRVRLCVNPTHMELVTDVENWMHGVGPAAINKRKTHCHNGHAFTPENTYIRGRKRVCRSCNLAWQAARRKILCKTP